MASGAIIDWVETAPKCHECRIFRRMLHLFDQSDVVLGDRGFCSYANLPCWWSAAHAVMRAHQMRQLDYRQARSRLLRSHCYLDTSESSRFGLEPG